MKNFVKRINAFVKGLITGAVLYSIFQKPVKVFINRKIDELGIGKTSSNRFPSYYSKYKYRPEPVNMHRPDNWKQVYFKTRKDADEVYLKLKETAKDFGVATVSDFLSFSGFDNSWTDSKYGWTESMFNKVYGTYRGINGSNFYIDLPDPIELEF